jgi:Ras-related protein Rab-18
MVSFHEAEALAKAHGCQYCECSAKTRENVRKPFIDVVEKIVNSPTLLSTSTGSGGTVYVGQDGSEVSGCAC